MDSMGLGSRKTDFVFSMSALLTQEIETTRMVNDLVCLDDLPRVFEKSCCPEKNTKGLVKL